MGKKTCLTYVELPKKYLAACLKVLVNTFCVCYMDFMLNQSINFRVEYKWEKICDGFFGRIWDEMAGSMESLCGWSMKPEPKMSSHFFLFLHFPIIKFSFPPNLFSAANYTY